MSMIYPKLPKGYITRSTISVVGGASALFIGYELVTGNERFYRNWAMPMVHRLFDAESAHILGVKAAKYCATCLASRESRRDFPELHCTLFGRQLENPIGLAAGFDKNGEAIGGLSKMGFGFIEVGSVTPKAQSGNEKPRVFRLAEDQAVVNSYGFNSEGADSVMARVKRDFDPNSPVALGINIGKNKTTANAVEDYVAGVNSFAPFCDYLVVNVSSPNTPGLRSLQAKDELAKLLMPLNQSLKRLKKGQERPKLFVKISPDNSPEELEQIAQTCMDSRLGVDGLIISNTTIQRPEWLKSSEAKRSGGLSGAPLADISTECIANMYRLTGGNIPIIGCGGVDSGLEAFRKIKAGASAIQLYTALVYQGFPVVGRVKRELAELLHQNGYSNVQDAVGVDHKEKKKAFDGL